VLGKVYGLTQDGMALKRAVTKPLRAVKRVNVYGKI